MKRASYRDAIRWMACNDDCEWVANHPDKASVTACLVADLFDLDMGRVIADLRRELKRRERALRKAYTALAGHREQRK